MMAADIQAQIKKYKLLDRIIKTLEKQAKKGFDPINCLKAERTGLREVIIKNVRAENSDNEFLINLIESRHTAPKTTNNDTLSGCG